MVENSVSDYKDRKNEINCVTYAINVVNGAIFLLDILSKGHWTVVALNFLPLAAPIYTGVRGLITSLKKESHYNACCLTCMCKFSMVCMLIKMILEGTLFNFSYVNFRGGKIWFGDKRHKWAGTKSQLRYYAATGSFAFLNFVLLTAYSIYMYFEERIRKDQKNYTNCPKDVYQKYEKITLRVLVCALLVISTILYGLDMRINVTPECKYLYSDVYKNFVDYRDICTNSIVCGQGVICAIVGIAIAYYINFAVLRNLTFEKAGFLIALGIFGVVCMFILIVISSINATLAYDVEKHNVFVSTVVFAGLNFVLMICIIRIADSLTKRCASGCKPDVVGTNQIEANLYENLAT